MVRSRCVLWWLSSACLLAVACKNNPCEDADPTVHLELILSGVSPGAIRSLEILLDAGGDRFRRVYNLEDQLLDGKTSLSVEIVPAPTDPFAVAIDVRAFDAPDGSGEVVASRAFTMEAEPNGCNDVQIQIDGNALPDGGLVKDAGPVDSEPSDAGGRDAEAIDSEPIDGDPIDGGPVDADPLDAGPLDGEPLDAEPIDALPDGGDGPDTGCLDDDSDGVCNELDNCPRTPNPQQEDTDGVAAYPIPFMPRGIGNGIPVPFGDLDDSVSPPIPLGFNFQFFGNAQSEVRVSTNGFLSFQANPPDGCCNGQLLPDATAPNNVVALAWNDLQIFDPFTVEYEIAGAPPNRTFIIEFEAVHLCCSMMTETITVEAILFEGTNEIEIHTTNQPDVPDFTRGIEGPMGNRAAFLPGQASGRFPLTNDSVGFTTGATPDGIGDACANTF